MRTSPALPWSAETERGTIRLNKTVSQQDLLDGILKWTVSDYHGTNLQGVIARTSGNKLVLQDGNGQILYEIADFSQSTNVLELTRDPGSSESLVSVEFAVIIYNNSSFAATSNGRIYVLSNASKVIQFNNEGLASLQTIGSDIAQLLQMYGDYSVSNYNITDDNNFTAELDVASIEVNSGRITSPPNVEIKEFNE